MRMAACRRRRAQLHLGQPAVAELAVGPRRPHGTGSPVAITPPACTLLGPRSVVRAWCSARAYRPAIVGAAFDVPPKPEPAPLTEVAP